MMQKDEMRAGFAAGKTLIQEEWCNPEEVKWANELIEEGVAEATEWGYKENYQCSMRKVYGKKANASGTSESGDAAS